ncbi:GNAT family N-acetyltransferase [Paenibacillus typhae]|uniref:GNAT family N-acetyltransferase n=1 Tax=Paenibacillus typhae TaxID=1174501 RepID=UPI001C8D7C51|nr:GNAT family N-acetyltransferase [Paenibacillus typhae]MBY0011169.1 GNAT family N-acetyltransferase [Paenibacillus typhae]
MNLTVELAAPHEAYIIKNLYPLYLHDLSGHYGLNTGLVLNEHGIYEEEPEIRTLAQQYEIQNIWWEKPGCLYPFLFKAGSLPAGFTLIATPPHCAQGVDYFVNEFFVLQPFRGTGIARQAAVSVFERFKGVWELHTNPAAKNIIGQKFWRKTVAGYTNHNYHEAVEETFDGNKLVFRFSNNF